VETTKNTESTQLVPDTKTTLKVATKPTQKHNPTPKIFVDQKGKNIIYKMREMERAINNDKTKTTSSPSVQKTKPNKRQNTMRQWGL